MRYSLRQLEVFLAVAETNNVSQAASRIGLSQSAASNALAELEKQFDIQLFDRIGKRLQLNESGYGLRGQARALMDQAQALEQGLRQHAEAGPIKLGATLTVGDYLVVPLLAEYLQHHPQRQVDLHVDNTEHITERLLNFELDVAMVEGHVRHPDLHVELWRPDELVIVCAPEHPLANQKSLSDKQLCSANWILRERGSGTRQTFDAAMHELLPKMTIRMELQHTEAIRRAVLQNFGIACVSQIAVAEDIERGDLVSLSTPRRNLRRSFSFVLHRQKYVGAGIDAWLAYCREKVQRQIGLNASS